MSDLVKVYIYDDGDGPYWEESPYSTVGDWLRYSEQHAHMIPREQYEHWRSVRAACLSISLDMRGIMAQPPAPAAYQVIP